MEQEKVKVKRRKQHLKSLLIQRGSKERQVSGKMSFYREKTLLKENVTREGQVNSYEVKSFFVENWSN